MSVIHAPREPSFDARQGVLLLGFGLALAVLLLRLWYLQVVVADELAAKASIIRTVEVPKLAPRGLIVDRAGVPVATVQGRLLVTAVPSIVKKNPWVLDKLAVMLNTDREELAEKVEKAMWRKHFPTTVYVGAPIEVATKLAEADAYMPGIGIDTQAMRTYPDTLHFSHVLGYVWTPSENDLARIAAAGIAEAADYVGKDGLERTYERELMGVEGFERYEVDARRQPRRAIEGKTPIPGRKLILGLDVRLQRLAYEELRGRVGAVVALDPNTGEVLCLASSPTYDASLFEGGISSKDWKRLQSDPGFPLNNRATSSAYAPGSTFKIVTTFASILAGKFSTSRRIYCPGYYAVGRRRVRCENHAPGTVAFATAFEKSCNTYFATLGSEADYPKIREAALQVGLGKKTGIDLPSESRGLIPSDEWIKKATPDGRWYKGDTVNAAIGQGAISVTPLQMACLVALVANEGRCYRPHLVKAIAGPGVDNPSKSIEPELLGHWEYPHDLWDQLKSAMVNVIESGTARSARIPGLVWGGKTGSAEHRRGAKTHGWFVGIAPIQNPKIVIAVIVEAAGHGGDVAAPIAKSIVQTYLDKDLKSASTASNAARDARSRSRRGSASGTPIVR